MSLVQAELEARGIATVSLTVLPDITRRLMPPRALAVPFGLGDPLGAANDRLLQRRIIDAALALVTRTDVPVLQDLGGAKAPPLPKKAMAEAPPLPEKR